MEPAPERSQETRSAGRGLLSITFAKLYFIIAGYAVQLLLPRLLGGPETFGLYSAAMSVVSILTNVLIVATIQTVSKRVSEQPDQAPSTLRQAVMLQAVLGATLGGGLLLGAPVLADRVLLDPLLAPLFRLAAIVVCAYAIYAALVGSLNGQQRFTRQAALDLTYTTLRTLGILGAASMGLGVLGAVGGFAAAAVCVLLVALVLVGLGERGPRAPLSTWLGLMAPLWIYQLGVNLALQVDLAVLKRTVAELSVAQGLAPVAAAQAASTMAGFYRAAQTFAFVPYQLILSVTFVVFPMVSQAVSIGDADATRRYIRAATRLSLIVLCAVAAPISGAADGVMRLAYPDAYLAGAQALAVLSGGMVAFAMFVIGATILSGAGRPGLSAAITAVAVGLVISCNLAFVRAAGVGDGTLIAAATGTSIGTTFALIAVGIAVRRQLGAFLSAASAVRVALAAAIGWLVARGLPSDTALGALLALISGGVSYLVALVLLRELTRADADALFTIIRRRRA